MSQQRNFTLSVLITPLLFTILLCHSPAFGQCVGAPDGLVSWWTADNDALDAEGTNNGALLNGTTFTSGKTGRAFSFDGTDDFVQVPDSPTLDIPGAMSISFWAKLNTVDAWRGFISKSSYSGGYVDTAFTLKLTPAGRLNFLATSNGGESGLMWPESNSVVTAGAWHHYSVVYSPGSYVRFYIDGNLDADRTSGIVPSIYNSSQPIRIGSDFLSPINGSMDEVLIFNRALTGAEVASIYNSDAAGICAACVMAPSGLISGFSADDSPLDRNLLNNATLRNGATFTAGKAGRAFVLAGGAYADVRTPTNLPVGNAPRTVEMWIKTPVDLTSSTESGIFQYGTPSTANMFGLITSANAPGRLYLYGHSADVAGTTIIRPNIWYHVAVTYDGTMARLFVNGVLDNQGALNLNTIMSSDGMTLGSRVGVSSWTGQIDEPSIYDRALLPTEIQNIVSAGKGGKCVSCSAAPVGLTSWWPAEHTAVDVRGRNNGTLLNGATFEPGVHGQAFDFDGTDDLVAVPPNANLNITGSFTAEAWVYPRSLPNAYPYVMSKFNTVDDRWIMALTNDGGIVNSLHVNINGFAFVTPNNTVLPNQWNHVAFTYDGPTGALKLFTNGNLSYSGNVPPGLTTGGGSSLFIGGEDSFTRMFDGLIDEIGIYGRALSSNEIAANAVARSAAKCHPTATSAPSGLVAWWAGDGNPNDISGQTVNGTLLSAAGYQIAKSGQGFSFGGVPDSGVTVPHHSSLNILAPGFTTEFWMKANGAQPEALSGLVEKSHGYVDSTGWAFSAFAATGAVHFAIGDGGPGNSGFVETVSAVGVLDGSYHHVAGTWDGANMRLYIDGALQDTTAMAAPANNNRGVNIGFTWGNGIPQRFFNGSIDEVSVYNRSLSAAEIESIYAAGTAGKLKLVTTMSGFAVKRRDTRAKSILESVSTIVGDATVSFPVVTTAGETQEVPISLADLPPLPAGYQPGGLQYDVATSALYVGLPTVCFNLPALVSRFSGLRLLHLENGNWIERTDLLSGSPNLCTTPLPSLSPIVIATIVPTNAAVTVSGRVTGTHGGISNARVTLTDAQGNVRTARTNTFGNYRFEGVAAGSTYIVEVFARKYRFAVPTKVVFVGDEMTDINFEALE